MRFTIKDLIPVVASIVIFGGIAFVLLMQPANKKVTSFDQCIAAGFPAMESHPRQCRAGGVTYTEVLAEVTPDVVPVESELGSDAEMIRVTLPLPETVVTSPLTIEGEARGPWYFEASFPVLLLDGNGEELAKGIAQAKGEWMTEDFVPFTVILTYDTPSTDTGILVLEKDNPSGLPEHDASIKIPVRFK